MITFSCITSSCLIRNNKIFVDGDLVLEKREVGFSIFLKSTYDSLNINYPKFFKMDNLCKTGFLASELLLRNKKLKENFEAGEIAILFSNNNSSLDTDLLYQKSTQTIASPALFVYTLPNVLVGEICIRNQIKGENACFIFDTFDADFLFKYSELLFQTTKAKVCIIGWADFFDEKFEAFFYLVERNVKSGLNHSSENILKLYQNNGTIN